MTLQSDLYLLDYFRRNTSIDRIYLLKRSVSTIINNHMSFTLQERGICLSYVFLRTDVLRQGNHFSEC